MTTKSCSTSVEMCSADDYITTTIHSTNDPYREVYDYFTELNEKQKVMIVTYIANHPALSKGTELFCRKIGNLTFRVYTDEDGDTLFEVPCANVNGNKVSIDWFSFETFKNGFMLLSKFIDSILSNTKHEQYVFRLQANLDYENEDEQDYIEYRPLIISNDISSVFKYERIQNIISAYGNRNITWMISSSKLLENTYVIDDYCDLQ